MKQIVFFVFAFLCLTTARAQNGSGLEFGFGASGGLPIGGGINHYVDLAFGGDATLGYNFTSKYALLVRGGYMDFTKNKNSEELDARNLKSIGGGFVKLVGRYTFSKRFYVEPQAGFTRFSGGTGRRAINSSGLTYAGAAGMFLDKLKALDLSVRYEGTFCNNGVNFVALRFAYSLKPGTFF